MKKFCLISLLLLGLQTGLFANSTGDANVYFVFYATLKGKTGHVGIALDKYRVIIRSGSDQSPEIEDTVATGELTYYDLWPNEDFFTVSRTLKNIPGEYYKLPESSSNEITLNSIYDKGIPHKEFYPADGLLGIRISWAQSRQIGLFLDSIIESRRLFNATKFNCTDFVCMPLEKILNMNVKRKEFVLLGWSSTPNKLYRRMRKLDNVRVIKNADNKTAHSFLRERVFYNLFHHKDRNLKYSLTEK